jgi:hypothetical protein
MDGQEVVGRLNARCVRDGDREDEVLILTVAPAIKDIVLST